MTNKLKLKETPFYVIQAIIISGVAFISLRLGGYDLHIPFNYAGGDTALLLMFIKGILLNGWALDIPQLSAPYGMSAAAFPVMTSFDWLIMKGLSFFTSELGLVLNLFWLLTLVLSAWSAAVALRFLGINLVLSLVAGVLYAFLPYAFLRNVTHLNLVYYIVPLLSLLSIYIATGLQIDRGLWVRRVMYAACVAQGFNFIYFSFFSVLLFCFAAIYGYMNNRSKEAVKVAVVAIGLIVGATAINLSPSFYSWYKYGKPPGMNYKQPAEAEIYGAKIRKMIVPHKDNPVPIIGHWGKADVLAGYPIENENMTARLGMAGAAGFILLLMISLRLVRVEDGDGSRPEVIYSLAALTLFSLLMITVGGFGAIFNLAIASDIRTYNRFTVFISFYSFAVLALFIQKYRCAFLSLANWKWVVTVSFVVCFSLYDQLLDRAGLLQTRAWDVATYRAEKALLDKFDHLYPSGASTLQLPMTEFPLLIPHGNMGTFDHLHPFLLSDGRMRWSLPSFSQRHRAWQDRILNLKGDALLKAAIYSGFGVIWVDRFGYKDHGNVLIAELLSSGGTEVLSDNRHVIIDLRGAMEKIKGSESLEEFQAHVDSWINGVVLSWEQGFYGEENNSKILSYRWSNNNSKVVMKNFTKEKRRVEFEFDIASQAAGEVIVATGSDQWLLRSETNPSHYLLKFDVNGESKVALSFHAGMDRVNAPNDPRELYFYVSNPVVKNAETVVQNQ